MTLGLGSHGLMVGAWTGVMKSRFSGYALGRDGKPLRNDWYFGLDEQKVQREYELRTGQPQDGVVSEEDLHRLGLKPTLFSIHGTGQADPFGIGYPADMARRVLDLYHWQPVGNWPALAIPMDGSADAGERENVRLFNDRNITPGPAVWVDYSQGSIIGGRVRQRIRNGDLRGRKADLLGAVSIGNPKRPAGSYAGTVDPGGEGIDPDLETVVDPRFLNLAAPGDIYTTCPTGRDAGVCEMERAIFRAVFRDFTGKDSLAEQGMEILTNPIGEGTNAFRAMWKGGMFLAKGTGPHVRYHVDRVPGSDLTYYEFGVKHLRDLATTRLERLAALT